MDGRARSGRAQPSRRREVTFYELSGKVALVTGGARGIGRATADALHARGASVAIVDVEEEASAEAAAAVGERALGLGADVTDV